MLKVFKASPNAILPRRATDGAAGFDLCAAQKVIVAPCYDARATMPATVVATNLAVEIEPGYYGRIAGRSSMALKGITVGGGVIDSDFRGNLSVILFNHTRKPYEVNIGDRIAQLIIERCFAPEIQEVKSEAELSRTTRGGGGFGHTGV